MLQHCGLGFVPAFSSSRCAGHSASYSNKRSVPPLRSQDPFVFGLVVVILSSLWSLALYSSSLGSGRNPASTLVPLHH